MRLHVHGRELRGAVRDPVTGALVWSRGGRDNARALLVARAAYIEREYRDPQFAQLVAGRRKRARR